MNLDSPCRQGAFVGGFQGTERQIGRAFKKDYSEDIVSFSYPFFKSSSKDFFKKLLLEKEEERERSINWLPPCMHLRPRIEPATYVCVLTGNRTHSLSVTGRCSKRVTLAWAVSFSKLTPKLCIILWEKTDVHN